MLKLIPNFSNSFLEGDTIFIASDGVHDNLSDKKVIKALRSKKNNKAKALVRKAREYSNLEKFKSKKDDISVVVFEIIPHVQNEHSIFPYKSKRRKPVKAGRK